MFTYTNTKQLSKQKQASAAKSLRSNAWYSVASAAKGYSVMA